MAANTSSTLSTASSTLSVSQHPQLGANRKSSTTMTTTTESCVGNVSRVASGWRNESQTCREIHKPLLSSTRTVLCRPNFKLKSSPTSTVEDSSCNSSMISRSLVNILSEYNGQNELTTTPVELCDKLTTDSVIEDTTTVCRCKYCDPESVVWDVSQRCFSPNLMPPVVSNESFTSQSPLEKSSYSNSKLSCTNLKRSSSEPTSKPFTNPVVARVRSFSGSCDKGSQNLLVSSQIVTSHDGHRDIEVKFFSLSTTSSSSSSL